MSAPSRPLRSKSPVSLRRLAALLRKETWQIVRDPSSILIAFVMPMLLLFIFGYAVNLDVDHLRVGLLVQDDGAIAQRWVQSLQATPVISLEADPSREHLMQRLARGELRAVVVVPSDFSQKWATQRANATVQVLTDGAEPNSASFIAAYIEGVWNQWQQQMRPPGAGQAPPMVGLQTRTWFNPSAVSRNYLVPGSIAVVMTIIGALLTSLVVAREWERGTMEALLATPVTRTELLLSKVLPYFGLGMIAMLLCLSVATQVMVVPFRGSVWMLALVSGLFLCSALGLGLLLSSTLRNQFNAAQAALTAAFLPALMLSGFVYEIASMPLMLRAVTHIIPARYFATSLQTLFQAGVVLPVLLPNLLSLSVLALFWLGLTARNTARTLES